MNFREEALCAGLLEDAIAHKLATYTEIIEGPDFVACLEGDKVHITARISGLGGRQLLRRCRHILRAWFERQPVLYAPIRHGNDRAIALGLVLGFIKYAETDTHVWLLQTKEKFYGH